MAEQTGYIPGTLPKPAEEAVGSYYLEHTLDAVLIGKSMPDPDDAYVVGRVLDRIIRHTGFEAESVKGMRDDVQSLMRGLGELCSQALTPKE